MARIVINTTDAEDEAVVWATSVYNAQAGENETPAEFFLRHVRHKLAAWVQAHRDSVQVSRRELWDRATSADQAAIDDILKKYR